MTAEEIMATAIDAFVSSNVEFVIVGSIASNSYGVARSTQDIDFVIQATPGALQSIAERLGDDFERDPQLRFETVTVTKKSLFRHRQTGFELEVFHLSEDPHDQSRFRRRVSSNVLGRQAWILSPEDVVLTKLRWLVIANRSKDEGDLLNVLAVQRDALDWEYIQHWATEHGTLERLDQLRGQLGIY